MFVTVKWKTGIGKLLGPMFMLCFIQEEVRQLSDVRNLVNQLYEALNVEEHQLNKERELCGQLEELKVELEPLEQVSRKCL
jgi:hypothetical protein